jgi:hypothetical protein
VSRLLVAFLTGDHPPPAGFDRIDLGDRTARLVAADAYQEGRAVENARVLAGVPADPNPLQFGHGGELWRMGVQPWCYRAPNKLQPVRGFTWNDRACGTPTISGARVVRTATGSG